MRISGEKKKPAPKRANSDLEYYSKMMRQVGEGKLERPPTRWKWWRKQPLLWYGLGVITSPVYLIVLMRMITGHWPNLLP